MRKCYFSFNNSLEATRVTLAQVVVILVPVIRLLQPPVSVSLMLLHLSHGALYLFLFLPQCVSEGLGCQLQLCHPHLLRQTGPAGVRGGYVMEKVWGDLIGRKTTGRS